MLDAPKSFPCNQCGECCKRVNLLSETASLDRGDGTCIHFDDAQKLCTIYESRPDICRVDRQYNMIYKRIMSWDDFVELNLAGCQKLQTVVVVG